MKKKKIYHRIRLNKLNTFSNPPVDKKTEKVCKIDKTENRALTESITLTEKSAVDLVELMSYRLTKMYLTTAKRGKR